MIDGLDSDDFLFERAVVLVHVPEELELRGGRPTMRIESVVLRDRATSWKKRLASSGRSFTLRPFRMLVGVVLVGLDRSFFDPVQVDVEDASFLVIDPDGRVLAHDSNDIMGIHRRNSQRELRPFGARMPAMPKIDSSAFTEVRGRIPGP